MASVFVSHSSLDREAAEVVCTRLQAAGFAALFVDFDPDRGIPEGRNWERELYAQLRRSDAVIFLASEASIASRWCVAEISLARSLGRPVFPLRLQPGVALPLLADVQWTDLTEVDSGLALLPAGLASVGLGSADSFAWNPGRSPYPGLVPFASQDAAVFFGREQEIDRLVELLTPTLQRGARRFVAVVGPSGSGKSSLLHAGLLPRLARNPERWVIVPPLRPGQQPTAALAGSLAQAFADRGHPVRADRVDAALQRGPSGLVELAGELVDLAANGIGRPSVLLVIDQAEELLTRTKAHEQRSFLQLLSGALHEDSPVWVVAAVRPDFLSNAAERAGLAEVVDDSLVVEPLSPARLKEVIVLPAQRAGLEFDPGLVERMVEDTAGGDALPLLSYTLHELYQKVGHDGRITATAYVAVGGVVGALKRRADRLAEELDRRGLGRLVLPALKRLASVTGEGQPIRRRARRITFNKDEQVVVDAFVDASLLVTDWDPVQQMVVEVAHEALLRQWPPLREAIEADRAGLQLRSELERLAAEWRERGHDDSYLLRGTRLAMMDEWAGQSPEDLSHLEQQFLKESRAFNARFIPTELEAQLQDQEARLLRQASLLQAQERLLREQADRLRELVEFDARSTTAGGVFISYSHYDKDVVDALAIRFQNDKINFWRDEKDLLVGDAIDKAISKGIQRSDIFLVVLTPKSIHSRWVERELEEAAFEEVEGRKVILPVLAKNLEPVKMPPRLRRIRYADISPSFDDGYAQLVASIRGHLWRKSQAETP
jgi:hypothetical protein